MDINQANIIPAQAGYFLLQTVEGPSGGFDHLARDPIIAWQVTGPEVTPISLGLGLNDSLPILRPDGIVEADWTRYESEVHYAQEVGASQRRAPTAATA